IPRLGISKCDYQYLTSPCNPYPLWLHPEPIAFFDLKSQNKKGVLRLTSMSYTISLLSRIDSHRYKVLPSYNSSKPRLRTWNYLHLAFDDVANANARAFQLDNCG